MDRFNSLASALLLGFEADEELAARIARGSNGYPPYNIERLRPEGDKSPERLRITLAVAGFDENELDVSIEGNRLLIKGRQSDRPEADYLFRGIAARQFQRVFLLDGGMEVLNANLRCGLLSIDLIRPEPQRTIKKINVSASQ